MGAEQEVRFDGWTLDRRAGELLRDGRRTRLQGQPLAVLEALLERPGELVTREELIARLWPSGVVDFDTALNSAVRRLRTALGDHAETPRYVETIPRRGYRLIVEVQPPATVEASAPPEPASASPSGPREPRTTASRPSWPRVAVAVAVLLAGIMLAQPHRPGAGPGDDVARVAAAGKTQDLYQRARHLFQRRGPGDVERAREYFEQVVAAEPGHARAWSGLAGAYWIGTVEGRFPPEEGLARLRAAAERALALEPGLAEAHLRLANFFWAVGDLAAHRRHVGAALEHEPSDPLVLGTSASLAALDGRFDEAVELQRRALAAEPLSALARYNLASILFSAGRIAEAGAELRSLKELNPVHSNHGDLHGLVALLEGRFDEALAIAVEQPREPSRLALRAMALHGLGRRAESDAALRGLMESTPLEPLLVAEVHAFRGEADLAFEWLHAAAAASPPKPWLAPSGRMPGFQRHSPLLAPLRSDPRWQAWLEAAGLDSRSTASASLAMQNSVAKGGRR